MSDLKIANAMQKAVVEKKPPLRAQYDKEPDNDQFSVKKHSMFEYYMSM